MSCLVVFLHEHCSDLCSVRGESFFLPWLDGDAEIIAFLNILLNFATAEFGSAGFFTVPVRGNIIIVRICRKKTAGWAALPVCSAAVGIKSERFQNSSSNKSRRGVRGDTAVGRLLLGYNVLRDDSVTRAGRLWTVWRVLRDSSANCEDLLRRVRPFLCLNQA